MPRWGMGRAPALLAAVIAAASGAALAAGSGNQAVAGSGAHRNAVKGVPAHFGVFKRARAASTEVMPAAAQLEQSLGVVQDSERPAGRGLWAAYSGDRVCAVFTDPIEVGHAAISCALRSYADHGVVGWTSPAPSVAREAGMSEDTIQLFALEPDDVTSVSYELPDGSSRTVRPVDNGVTVTLPSAPVAERVTTTRGVRTQSFNKEAQR
jgi:hypothetical protein